LQPLVYDDIKSAEDIRAWLSAKSLSKYLAGQPLDAQDLVAERDLFDREPRFGVGLTTASSARPRGCCIRSNTCVPLKTLAAGASERLREDKWDKRGLLNLGGEMRAARYEMLDAEPPVPRETLRTALLKLPGDARAI